MLKDTEFERAVIFPTLAERDNLLEMKWKEFEDIPMNPETEKIEQPFFRFPAGTDRAVIWNWFDKRHSKGIRYLLYNEEPDNLLEFIKYEVPFRLREILNVPEEQITPELIDACVKKLYDNSDIMFDYDSIDNALEEECQEFDIYID